VRFVRTMKHVLVFVFLVSAALGKDLAAQKQKIRDTAATNDIDLRLDQPYAGNENPKQRVDVYLPKKRNSEKPLPVIALIHGGGWVNGDRLGYGAQAIQLARTGDYAAVTVGYRLTKEASWPARCMIVKRPSAGFALMRRS